MNAFEQAEQAIDRALQEGKPVILAIEGGAASGKTTLAGQLAAAYLAPVIAMDDFFLPPALRTPERLSEAGGNIHYERFCTQVAQPLLSNRPVCYDRFSCQAGRMTESRTLPPVPLLIVEGVYSLHPAYRAVYTLRMFVKTDKKTQDARLRARGDTLYRRFVEAWLPMEEAYFCAFAPEKDCDLVLFT